MEADIVIFGTGFRKSYAYLDSCLYEKLSREQDGLYLYRNMFPTKVPDLCFVGSEVSTFNNILTQGLQALWLRHVLTGHVSLPSVEEMDLVVDKERSWKRSWMPKKGDRAAILQLHKMAYHDQLCGDMGVNPHRKGWNVLAEAFAPYSAADYVDLFPSGDVVMSAAEMEAHRGIRGKTAGVVLVMALLAIALALIASGGCVELAVLIGATVLGVPAVLDVARRLYIGGSRPRSPLMSQP